MLRSLIKNWQLNSIAVFSLAVAIAVGVVALSISNMMLLRPPVARDPGQLVTIYAADQAHNGQPDNLSYLEYRYLEDHARSFSGVAAFTYGYSKTTITFGHRDEFAMTNAVSDNYFQVMGIQPYMGRFFTPGDDQKHTSSVVLTYACWRRWGSDPAIVGKSVEVGREMLPIIGVAPQPFLAPVFGIGADLILHLDGPDLENRKAFRCLLIGRLKAGASRPQARAPKFSRSGANSRRHIPSPRKAALPASPA